ncbi:uncharacterized protein, partial [Argopecten irradians]|uniref:uncharacterized protein n=1 Tax=Argopecten irradians TaxID=31199 RepID=UPI0037103F05
MSDTAMEATPLTDRSDSPILPKDEAYVPGEDAHQNTAGTASDDEDPTISAKQELKVNESPAAIDEVDGDIGTPAGSLLTKEMIEEEEQLNKEGEEEDKKQREEHAKLWDDLDQDIKEQRYKRLQFLLSKSNMYTQYLLERMKKQNKTDEEKKRKELKEKRRLKAEEKKRKEVEIQTPAGSLLTKEMIEEEEQLNKEGEEEDKKQREEHAKLWDDLDQDIKEQRYKRLQFLLSKSNMYTQYLLERMKKQTDEEKKRKELKEKRRLKAEEKKRKEVEEQKAKNMENTNEK